MPAAKLPQKSRNLLLALIAVMVLLFALNLVHTYVGLERFAFWGYPYVRSFIEDHDNPIKMKKSGCSPFFAPGEAKEIKISLTNSDDRQVTAYLQTVVSNPGLQYGAELLTSEVPLEAGETQVVSLGIDDSNIADGRFILSRSFVSWQPVYVSNRSIACHSVVIPIKGISSDIVGYGLFAILIISTITLAVLFRNNDPFTIRTKRTRSSLTYVLVVMLVMTIGSLTGSLVLSFAMIVLLILGFLAFWQVNFQ